MNDNVTSMRPEYRQLSDLEKSNVKALKDIGATFVEMLDALKKPETLGLNAYTGAREFALVKTKIEEAVMWATKGVTG